MQPTTTPAELVTCARSACGARVPFAESTYVDGAGQLCAACFSPLPQWAYEIELPY
jgi:hypothetical protein